MDDEQVLRELNAQIREAENDGNRDWLASILAPRLAFQRADTMRTVDNRDALLQVQSGGKRKTLRIGPIDVQGDWAIVQSIVAVDDDQEATAKFRIAPISWPTACVTTPMFASFRQVASSSIERCQQPYSREQDPAL